LKKQRPSQLTAIQVETLQWLAQGFTCREIAKRRNVSLCAVYEVLGYAQDAMQARTREQLISEFVVKYGIGGQEKIA